MNDEQRPKVGVGVIIFKDSKVLLGKRKSQNGFGTYGWPGGHLEYKESIVACAKREVQEETGMEIKNVRFLRLLNIIDQDRHYVDIAMISDWESGEPKLQEPDKCESWNWYDLDDLPHPLFGVLPASLEALKTGKNFFDA